jgi:hypothetical protein
VDGKHIDCTKRKAVKAMFLGVKVYWTQVSGLISIDPVGIEVPDPSLSIFLAFLIKQF